ncbi:DNA repair protein RecN [Neptunicella marina]|uniref:DNA repair protein RecN n=1 Tax=Neptunicella marina TaxID=2125989 RepID=A0A8J6ITN2_9ALTE|nr:DNA repair protein RecN [Neptunicella marina]MBC3767200.1 DNA repair protein RecN [Neptunicella marina]
MLIHLSVRQFAIVKSLDIEFKQGMTAITGETGAGKSIAIDALGLCLGDRAEASMVRPGADKAEVTAEFSVADLPGAQKWLEHHELQSDEPDECIIRRVISAEGRSRAFINGAPAPLQLLKALGQHLISIHGQHAHHQLLKADNQRVLLDQYGGLSKQQEQVKTHFTALGSLKKRFNELQASQSQRQARRQLLEYQVSELDDFALQPNEFGELESEYKRVNNAQVLLEQSQLSFYQLYADEEVNALSLVQNSIDKLSDLQDSDPALTPIVTMLQDASIQINEAAVELRSYLDDLEIDPFRMQQVEQRFNTCMDLARKHHVAPEQLYDYHQTLAEEFKNLQQDDDLLDNIEAELQQARQQYVQSARMLSEARRKHAARLSKQVESQIHKMNMSQARFEISVLFDEHAEAQANGLDEVDFTVSTNPGLPMDSLDKVASGGELSRIGLAIQVLSSASQSVPSMIFDEVDTGISGPTASVVGSLLRQLGESSQVICVTHLPQVAARANNQMFVAKFSDKQTTETSMIELDEEERINELARLLAGDTLTESAIANAKELLKLN